MLVRPHDLIWLKKTAHPPVDLPAWAVNTWNNGLPVVVRRDRVKSGALSIIPVGIRGNARYQRIATFIKTEDICRIVTPECLAQKQRLSTSQYVLLPQIQGAIALSEQEWPWTWGITGSCGYTLATNHSVMHYKSDLDLIIRCPHPIGKHEFKRWESILSTQKFSVDTQIDTPHGGFALNDWLNNDRVLLKTSFGPYLTKTPWQAPKRI